MPKQELGMAEIAAAIVGDAMKEQNPVAAWRRGNDLPAAKFDAVTRADREIRLACASSREHLVCLRDALRIQVCRMPGPIVWPMKPAATGKRARIAIAR